MSNPIETALAEAGPRFASMWRAWMSQWTQPQMLRLADAYLGARLFHSSQMGGFATQKLRHPAPKAFMAIGYLNLALARSVGFPPERVEAARDIGLPQKLPGALRGLWEDREPLCDGEGVALGPTGLFEAFSGLLELPGEHEKTISEEMAEEVVKVLGRWLRLRFAAQGVDWLERLSDMKRDYTPTLESLLLGRSIQADRLLRHLPMVAKAAGCSVEEVWAQIEGVEGAPE